MGLDRSVDITAEERKTVLILLARCLPNTTAWVYGSRVKWTARPESDLDVVVFATLEQAGRISELREAFEESNLPFRVDLFVWDKVPEQFRKQIQAEHVVLVQREERGVKGSWRITPFARLFAEPVRNGIYKKKEFHGRGTKIVNMGELFAHPRLTAVPMKRVELSESEIDRFLITVGDLLFARRSLVAEGAGKCCVVLDVDEPTTFESSIIRVRLDSAKADCLYFYYFFRSALGLHHLDTIRRQVAVAGITGSDLAKLDIPVPPPSEQRAIAQILGTLDDKIELNRCMNRTLEEMARAMFKSWFVDFDPVRAKATLKRHDATHPQGKRVWSVERARAYLDRMDPDIATLFPDSFVDSELGPIPEGWEVGTLGSLAVVSSGKRPSIRYPTASSKASIPLWGGNGPMAFVPEALVDYPVVLTGRVGTLGSVFRITSPCYPSDNTLVLRAKCNSSFDYIRFNLEMVDFEALNRGSTQPLLTQGDLKAQSVLLPPVSVLKYFNRCMSCIFKNIDGRDREFLTLTALRNVLLPKLISGDVRVKDEFRH